MSARQIAAFAAALIPWTGIATAETAAVRVEAVGVARDQEPAARDPVAANAVLPPPECIDGAVPVAKIKAMITAEAKRQKADVKLALAIAGQESGFGANVNSPAGARGPMQLMPDTAAHYRVEDVCDAAQNIRGGIAFIQDLKVSMGGNIMLMLAAYNAGEPRVVKARGIPANAETVNYVATVTNAYYGFANTFRGGTRARLAGSAQVVADDAGEAPPIAIDTGQQPRKRGDQWVNDSVLYVDTGDLK